MTKRKNKDSGIDTLIKLALSVGSIYLLYRIFKTPKQAGISGLPGAKKFFEDYCDERGRKIFEEDLKDFNPKEIGFIIQMIIKARMSEHLKMPFYKTLKGTKITGELRDDQFRILLYQISSDRFLMLNVFKKKTNETPKAELCRAESRLEEYLSRKQSIVNKKPQLFYIS